MADNIHNPTKFSQLVKRAGLIDDWRGSVDPSITAIVEDSRKAEPGCCFVAVRGTQVDGHQFVEGAVGAGAVAVVCEQPVTVPENVAVLRLPSARGVAGRLASILSGLDEALEQNLLKIVGITGTNGKSTFCYLLQAIMQTAERPTALLGTVQYDLLSRQIEASHTTPPAVELVGYLAEAVRAGATHAVMEVSSHALDQGRCDGLRFAVGAFSNLTGDHLDYHHDMESYLRAKKLLFDGLDAEAAAVINRDDPACERMVVDCQARIIRYGIEGGPVDRANATTSSRPSDCEVVARILEQNAEGTRFRLMVRPGASVRSLGLSGAWEGDVFTPLIGNHNVQNCLAAVSAAVGVELPLEIIACGLESVQVVPGRLQRVPAADNGHACGFSVFVDYAHTDDALENVLSTLKPFAAGGRLIVLFGCGGDRDRTKRPRMARTVAKWADCIMLTSDNPRTEEPLHIIDDVMAGFVSGDLGRVHVQPDRRQAIEAVLNMAGPADVILLAGKGHENYQIIGKQKFPFDDAAIAAEILESSK